MKLEEIITQLTVEQIKDFVISVNKIVNQLLIPLPEKQEETSKLVDYEKMPNHVPKGGWISPNELRQQNQQMIEAISNEKWLDGFTIAVGLLLTLVAQ